MQMKFVLCAVDSTISSGLNSLAAVCLQDLLRLLCFKEMSEKHATLASKLICKLCVIQTSVVSITSGQFCLCLCLNYSFEFA